MRSQKRLLVKEKRNYTSTIFDLVLCSIGFLKNCGLIEMKSSHRFAALKKKFLEMILKNRSDNDYGVAHILILLCIVITIRLFSNDLKANQLLLTIIATQAKHNWLTSPFIKNHCCMKYFNISLMVILNAFDSPSTTLHKLKNEMKIFELCCNSGYLSPIIPQC